MSEKPPSFLDAYASDRPIGERKKPSTSMAPETWLDREMAKAAREEVVRTVQEAPSPDQVARTVKVARDADTTPFSALGREDELERKAQVRRFNDLMAADNAIASFFARNPRSAALAVDDDKSLARASNAFNMREEFDTPLWNGAARVGESLRSGWSQASGMLWDFMASTSEVVSIATYPADALRTMVGQALGDETDYVDRSKRRTEQWRKYARDLGKHSEDVYEAAPSTGSDAIDQVIGGVRSMPLTIAAAATRNPKAGAAALGTLVGNSAMQEGRDQGLSFNEAFRYGAAEGSIEAGTELLPLGTLVGMITKRTPFGKAFMKEMGQELAGEQVATFLQDANAAIMLEPDKTIGEFLAERPDAAYSTALATVGGVTGTTVTIRSAQKTADVAAKVAGRVVAARRARVEAKVLDDLGDAAEGSKLRERDPEEYRRLMSEMAKAKGADTVYISGEAVREFRQSDMYDPQLDPFQGEEWDDAVASGGDVAVPLEDALTDLAGTPAWEAVKGNARFSAGGMTAREADTFDEAVEGVMEDLSREMEASDRAEQSQRTAREKMVERLTAEFGSAYAPGAARAYAEIAVRMAEARSQLWGDDLTGDELNDLSVRLVMPEGVAEAVRSDEIDLVINAMRKGADPEIGVGSSLLEFIRERGGINDVGGDLASMGLPASMIREFNPDQGALEGLSGAGDYGIDSTMRAAIEAGFFGDLAAASNSELDTQRMLDAIGQELAGSPVYAETRIDQYRDAGAQLREVLSEAGLNPDGMSDAEIRSVLDGMEAREGGRGFEQVLSIGQRIANRLSKISGRKITVRGRDARDAGRKTMADKGGTTGLGRENIAGQSGTEITLSEKSEGYTLAEEIRHMIDTLLGSKLSFWLEANGATWVEIKRWFNESRRDLLPEGTVQYNEFETAQALIHAYVTDPDAIREAFPEVAALLEEAGIGDYEAALLDLYDDLAEIEGDDARALEQSLPETIEIDGVSRSTVNSEGQPLAATEEGVRAFWKWFGDSRVVDADGRPLVVYHGTPNAEFEAFSLEYFGQTDDGWLGEGFYFTPDVETASAYATIPRGSTSPAAQGSMFPVYLKIENPLETDYDMLSPSDERQIASGEFDGVRGVEYRGDEMAREWVAFSPTQIKSFNNRGTFDPDDARILYQGGETLDGIKEWASDNGLDISLTEREGEVEINMLRSSQQGQGVGGEFMARMGYWADQTGARLLLTPEKVGNTSVSRLKAFYKRHGFVENKGRSKDFSTRAGMIREPSRTLNQQARGRIIFDEARRTIELFKDRNLSTAIHELGHLFVEQMSVDAAMPNAPQQIKDDYDTLRAWWAKNGVKVENGEPIPTEAHELTARGFERYFMEGKAPSTALQRIFETVSQWMLNIYKTVKNLNAPITPEVREVFDRALATREEIEAAREISALDMFFKEPIEGMEAEEFQAYQTLVDNARKDAAGDALQKAMGVIKRREEKKYRKVRKEIREEETQRIDEAPLFRAQSLMKDDRISSEWLEDAFGADVFDLLPRRVPPLWADGGVDPATIAERSGYSSARDMIEALIGAERRHRQAKEGGDKRSMRVRAIDEATEAEFSRRYGDPFADGSIETEALAAAHNEAQGEVMAEELRILGKSTRQRATPYKAARQWARNKIRSGVIAEEAMPSAIQRYQRNASKAGREAQAAMIAQDRDEAFRQKQFQMLNSALLAEAKQAQDEVDKARKRLEKIAKARTRETIDQDYLEQAHGLLEAVDLKKRSQVGIDRLAQWEDWAASRQAEGHDVVAPPSFAARIGKTNWSRLSVNDLMMLDEQVKQIIHLGRKKKEFLDNKERRDRDAVIAEVQANGDNIGRKPPQGSFTDPNWWERIKNNVAAFDAGLLKMEQVFDWLDDGKSDGPFNRIVFRPIADAQAQARSMTEEYFGKLRDAASQIEKKTLRSWADRVTLDLIDPETGLPAVFERKKLVAMALNWGNAGNRQRLADGYGWNESAIKRALDEHLTEAEWQYVQDVWDIIDGLWPEIERVEKAVNGVAPEKVEATEVVTPFGKLRGGYYPAIYDSTLDYDTEAREGRKSDLFGSNYIRATTRASSTKDRGERVERPILLDTGVIVRHVGEVIHDISHREAVMNANDFLNDKRVMRTVDETLGREVRKQMQPWLNYVANSWAHDRAGNEGIGKFMSKLRANTTVVGMGWRFTTIMTQIAGYSNSFEYVGAKWVAPEIAKFAAQMAPKTAKFVTFQGVEMPEMMAFAMENSKELPERLDTLDRDIRREMDRLAGRGVQSDVAEGLTAAKRFAFHGIGYMDRMVSVPTWMAQYKKSTAEGLDHDAAVFAADKAVRLSQGGGAPKDLAAVARGTGRFGEAFKLLTMFYTYLSTVYNRQRTLGRDAVRGGVKNLPNVMARGWWLIVVPPLLAELLSGRGPDEDEEAGWWAFKKMASQSLGAIPVVRDAFEPTWDAIAGRRAFDYRLSPVQGAGQSVVNVGKDVGKVLDGKSPKKPVRNTIEMVGYTTGFTTGQMGVSAQFLVDVANGEADPDGFEEWYKGITKGKVED